MIFLIVKQIAQLLFQNTVYPEVVGFVIINLRQKYLAH